MFLKAYRHRPLVSMAMAAEMGALLGMRLGRAEGWWLLACLGLVWIGLTWHSPRRMVGYLLAVLSAYAALAAVAEYRPSASIRDWVGGERVCVEGRLREWPTGTFGAEAWQADLECHTVVTARGRVPTRGGIRIRVPGYAPRFSGGDELRVCGRLEDFEHPGNPGEFDYRRYMQREGIWAQCRVSTRAEVVRLRTATGWRAWSASGHRHWMQAIRRWVPRDSAEVVCSLVLGDRSGLTRTLQESMAATGLAHVFAVSGMNVGVVVGSFYLLGRWWRIPRAWILILAFVGVAAFASMVGSGASVSRAWLMTWLGLWVLAMRRQLDGVSVLSAVALGWLAYDPLSCGKPGFLLSFMATTALVVAAPKLPRAAWPGWWGRGGRLLFEGAGVTIIALVGTLPLQVYYFYSVTPVAILTNVVVVPLVTLGTDGGLLLGLLDPVCPWLARGVGWVVGWSAEGLVGVARWAEHLPYARIFVGGVSAAWVAGCYLALMAWCWKPLRLLGLVGVCMCTVAYGFQRPPEIGSGVTQFTFLDLGMGEATLLEQGADLKILIDTGTESEFLWRVKPFLASQGINRLSTLVVSHPDADHAGGVELCVKYFQPRRVITAHSLEPTLARVRDAVHRSGGTLEEAALDTTLTWTPTLAAQVVWPEVGFARRGEPREGGRRRRARIPQPLKTRSNMATSNDRSLVLRWTYPGGSALFPGDAGRMCEDLWAGLSPCTLLKVAHHGSKGSSGERLLQRLNPQLAVVQPGFFQTHRFPHPDTVARFRARGVPLLNTARRGAIRVQTDGAGRLRWECWK